MEKVNRKSSKNLFYFLLALVLLRPSLDIISQRAFQIHRWLPEINLNIIIGGLVFLLGLIYLIKNIKSIKASPLFWPICLFLGLSLASIFYSINRWVSLQEFIRLASIFLLYFLAYQLIEGKKDWQLLLKIILISYLLPGTFALVQLITNQGLPDDFGGFNRLYGTFAHPNPFAFYTLFILGLVLSLTLIKKEYLFLLIILTFLLLATYTRSALAGFFIFLLFFGFLKYRKLLLAGLALFWTLYFFSDIFQQRLWELISLDPYGSLVWRLRLWQDMLTISLWQPWFGYGAGTFSQLTEFYRGFRWGSLQAHNDYLKLLVENGLLGLLAYGWLVLGLFYYLIKIVKKARPPEKILGWGILMISLSLFTASFFDNVLRTTALQWNFWILLAGWLKIKKPRCSI